MTGAPSRTELTKRAADLVPLLKENARWVDENRRLPDEVIEAVTAAGILRMRVPKRYGGYESDMGTVVEVLAELARGCGSTSWVSTVWALSSWMAAHFPDSAQDEVFTSPDVRICGALSPTAVATPVDGGLTVNGKWSFNSGARHSTWNSNAAVIAHPDGRFEPVMILVPMADLTVVDDWHTVGLRGSGSITTIAEEVFVPQDRMLLLEPVLQGNASSTLNADSPVFRAPFMPTACATITGTPLGLAYAAKEAFFERLPGRKITYTEYTSQQEAPLTHLQVAEALTKVNEAEFHAGHAAAMIDGSAADEQPWKVEQRARIRLEMGMTTQRAKEAVDILAVASGGSSVYHDVPIQRIERDIKTIGLHAIMHPDTNAELYGRVACGLEPNTQYI
ncbi:MAG TPA: acyl-CoA dehydrogenase family protein [Amycolatopsis sp.]|jgi:alkylation response protein AidB-like acyl-CoA dehydrogenase